ncbi:MAG: hypothetical protein DRI57_08220 [Deltaproteobacteria bacterium]|nr:MAG: hypothetical protein DRI57_08220 [Deltaproteobacteria bacterium]
MGRLIQKKRDKGRHLSAPAADPPSPDREHPVFSFRHLQKQFGIGTCDPAAFVRQLRQVSQLTWMQWKLAPRQGMGLERIPRTAIRTEIPRAITNDVGEFFSFRFTNGRVVGFRDRSVFHIVWTDGTFRLYKH